MALGCLVLCLPYRLPSLMANIRLGSLVGSVERRPGATHTMRILCRRMFWAVIGLSDDNTSDTVIWKQVRFKLWKGQLSN